MDQPEKTFKQTPQTQTMESNMWWGPKSPLVPCGKGRVINPIVGFYILQR